MTAEISLSVREQRIKPNWNPYSMIKILTAAEINGNKFKQSSSHVYVPCFCDFPLCPCVCVLFKGPGGCLSYTETS